MWQLKSFMHKTIKNKQQGLAGKKIQIEIHKGTLKFVERLHWLYEDHTNFKHTQTKNQKHTSRCGGNMRTMWDSLMLWKQGKNEVELLRKEPNLTFKESNRGENCNKKIWKYKQLCFKLIFWSHKNAKKCSRTVGKQNSKEYSIFGVLHLVIRPCFDFLK